MAHIDTWVFGEVPANTNLHTGRILHADATAKNAMFVPNIRTKREFALYVIRWIFVVGKVFFGLVNYRLRKDLPGAGSLATFATVVHNCKRILWILLLLYLLLSWWCLARSLSFIIIVRKLTQNYFEDNYDTHTKNSARSGLPPKLAYDARYEYTRNLA